MIINKYAATVAVVIGASSLTVVLIILKCYGIPIDWPYVFLPLLIVAGIWVVAALSILAVNTLVNLLIDRKWLQ